MVAYRDTFVEVAVLDSVKWLEKFFIGLRVEVLPAK